MAVVPLSVSKSIIGCLVGILADHAALAVDDLVTHHVPELAASGYAGARIRDLLDMRSGIRFSEAYLDPHAEVRLLPAVLRAAAFRFWLSRAWDLHLPRDAVVLTAHDPTHFERILVQRRDEPWHPPRPQSPP